MDIRIDKNQLLRGLYLAHGIADRKSTMPILANVLLRSEGKDKIICAATDLNVAVVATLPAKVESATLRAMIAKTIFSVSQDEPRQHLAGVLFESDGQTARMVSTDGHRLSKVGRAMPGGPVLPAGVIIPRKGVGEIRRALEGRETPCEIGVHQGYFVLKVDDIALSVKLGDGTFPPY